MHYGLMTYRGCFALLGYPALPVLIALLSKRDMSDVADTPLSAETRVLVDRRKKRFKMAAVGILNGL